MSGIEFGVVVLQEGAGAIVGIVTLLLFFAVPVATLVGLAKVFSKADQPAWAAVVPVYNILVLLEVADLPVWYIVLFLVPVVNLYAQFKVGVELADRFGKDTAYGVGVALVPFVFFPLLGFGDATYSAGGSGRATPAEG